VELGAARLLPHRGITLIRTLIDSADPSDGPFASEPGSSRDIHKCSGITACSSSTEVTEFRPPMRHVTCCVHQVAAVRLSANLSCRYRRWV
jgi:hypothetical protein